MSTVSLESLTKRYGETLAVDGLDLSIRDGEILGVVGPSGCGKTTTLRTIAGFETPTEGCVRFDGRDVTHVPPERRNVGLVFQSYALFDTMSVRANVAFGLEMRDVPADERRARADELLEMLDIAELADRRPTTLSGGQQQRVGLARALAIEPHVLLLDEPMTGLDAALKSKLRAEIGDLLADLGVTALYVTHDQSEAMAMCDRIAVLNDGRLEQIGTPVDVYERPENAFIADFIGTSNVLEGTVRNGRLDLDVVELEGSFDGSGPVRAVVRPESLDLGGPLETTVERVTYLGERTELVVTLPDDRTVTLRTEGSAAYSRGDALSVGIDPTDVRVLE